MNTLLAKKLGLNTDTLAIFLHAPENYTLPKGNMRMVANIKKLPHEIDWLQSFYTFEDQLLSEIDALEAVLNKNGKLWISWPKKSSAVASDLSDNLVRQIGVNAGLVDVKVVSIDNIWSALKFVHRLKDR